ncbi:DUF4387 family protein [Granulosicoccus sp. 3-233]|uniref:DUF4387 family protein n=1 Tax=Granulosicoccus sp. 3-233 TaxID=3417969 RepID=UPI003D32B970
MKVSDLADSVRSKNAGPFWVTIDIFCGNESAFHSIRDSLQTEQIATALGQPTSAVKRFDIDDLNVVKFSVHRPVVQGHPLDRDQHGAQWSMLIEELELRD